MGIGSGTFPIMATKIYFESPTAIVFLKSLSVRDCLGTARCSEAHINIVHTHVTITVSNYCIGIISTFSKSRKGIACCACFCSTHNFITILDGIGQKAIIVVGPTDNSRSSCNLTWIHRDISGNPTSRFLARYITKRGFGKEV